MGDTRLPEAMGDVMRILAAGINVVGSSPGLLQFPWGVMPDKYINRVEDAARQGNSTIFISGVDPGFANDLIPFALAGTCQRIESVRCMEIHDYASYDGVEVMNYMGFAKPMDEVPMLLQPGILGIAWGTAIRQLAAGLGIEGTPPSSSSTSPGCGPTCAPTGSHPPPVTVPTASRSPVSRPMPWTSCRAAARVTTTTPRSPVPPAASSTPSRPCSPRRRESRPPSSCRW